MREWEGDVTVYFANVKGGVKDEDKVAKVLTGFRDPLIKAWLAANDDHLKTLDFDDFLTEFRDEWLPTDWEADTRAEIVSSNLNPLTERFADWTRRLRELNVTLIGTPSHFNDRQMRAQLESCIDKDLRQLARLEDAHKIRELVPWVNKLRDLDLRRTNDRKRRHEEFLNWQTKERQPGSSRYRPTDPTPRTRATDKPPSEFPPKLTPDERRVLQEHDGCFKCRKLNAGHRASDCSVILSGKGYKPVTAPVTAPDTAQKTAPSTSKGPRRNTTIAATAGNALNDDNDCSQNLVAALFTNNAESDADDLDDNPESVRPQLKCEHLIWNCLLTGPTGLTRTNALIDSGAHMVLIRASIVKRLGLTPNKLPTPELVNVAMNNGTARTLTHYIDIEPTSRSTSTAPTFRSKPLRAVVADNLCAPLILGLPFLVANNITCNYARRECNVTVENVPVNILAQHQPALLLKPPDTLAYIHQRTAAPPLQHILEERETELRKKFHTVFEPLPHTDELPREPVARIQLKNDSEPLKTRNYPCPRKWKEAWHTLLQQHLDAGRIRPSNAPAGSGAFIIPKADPTVLPRWVNDYRQLNSNTITDSFPLPRVSEILADCGNGTLFASIDMTNSFFQTRMHPNDVNLTAVNTPWGLYEWVVMPMGIKNAPAIHQRRVTAALRPFIGRFCHVYLDDIVIWSKTLDEHTQNVILVLDALKTNKLYCNPKKTKLYCTEIRFLGHRISANGIEADEGKADRITNWPIPSSAKQMRGFLGLVRYLATFLPKLADHTTTLDALTKKECDKKFPEWTQTHQEAFDNIKHLATSTECLTTIDYSLMPDYKIFVTTDASDYGSGAVLSFGPSYEKAKPVAYDSRSFKGAELNYPVHEKEMLAIVRALKKFRTDLLGHKFQVWTDHKTLEHFPTQRDLSRRQARWLEFLSQYDATIRYLPGEKNVVADALSRLPDTGISAIAAIVNTTNPNVHSRFEMEDALLDNIRTGYDTDPFTKKLASSALGMPNIREQNGFWFVDDRLFVPNVKNTRETLFRIAHDKLGHFGTTKTYNALRDAFYWPGMKRDLGKAYVPSCPQCQRNKSRTTKPVGPLHPLSVPDKRCDSVAMDFIGPLPRDDGFDCILTITDRLGSDIRIIPTTCSLTAQGLAELFFQHWYCENGLPLEIISDRDKLFLSQFWQALHQLTGVHLKLSTSYHPETDGASERTNKTVIQCIRFAVERDQKGWAKALPKVRFDIMNTLNQSTGFSPFQLRFGKSPRILPPLLAEPTDTSAPSTDARTIVERLLPIEYEAKDNLLTAKIDQAEIKNRHRRASFPFRVGERVLLSTANRRHEYKTDSSLRVAKFMPRFDGPYDIIATNEKHSTVTLLLPHAPNAFPVFHSSEVIPFLENDNTLFPDRVPTPPEPLLINGEQEFFIDKIVDERRKNKQTLYRVRWQGEGPEGDKWLPTSELENCQALDVWLARKTKLPKLVLRY
jgi:hypothetical protein